MADIFEFQQFSVDQAGCAMKVNTDGVLLGALATAEDPENILDVGSGTGVIALMLAQRFPDAEIDAVEIDIAAAETAENNFNDSPFSGRLTMYPQSFQDFFSRRAGGYYDLIVSNPPFYTNSLASPDSAKTQAKHAGPELFTELIAGAAKHLHSDGALWLIVPTESATHVKHVAWQHELFVQHSIKLHSFVNSEPHREIIAFGFEQTQTQKRRLFIYEEPGKYTDDYKRTLKDFLTIFR